MGFQELTVRPDERLLRTFVAAEDAHLDTERLISGETPNAQNGPWNEEWSYIRGRQWFRLVSLGNDQYLNLTEVDSGYVDRWDLLASANASLPHFDRVPGLFLTWDALLASVTRFEWRLLSDVTDVGVLHIAVSFDAPVASGEVVFVVDETRRLARPLRGTFTQGPKSIVGPRGDTLIQMVASPAFGNIEFAVGDSGTVTRSGKAGELKRVIGFTSGSRVVRVGDQEVAAAIEIQDKTMFGEDVVVPETVTRVYLTKADLAVPDVGTELRPPIPDGTVVNLVSLRESMVTDGLRRVWRGGNVVVETEPVAHRNIETALGDVAATTPAVSSTANAGDVPDTYVWVAGGLAGLAGLVLLVAVLARQRA